ncbi:MAG: EAL domain-containing protein [bacterium]|nr:EAL domain-containing protein [bacterium]
MNRRVLIVEDHEMNRELLRTILESDYDIMTADNGVEAIQLLQQEYSTLSAVILDLIMPKMDGFEVLRRMRQDANTAQIPVIVATGKDDRETEGCALEAGANDYITKPYDARILKNRLKNTIHLREQSAIINAAKTDALTGLMSRAAFFDRAREMVAEHEAGYYIMSCFDIIKFRVINDQYGNAKGDDVLRQIAAIFQEHFKRAGAIMSRISADNFALLYPVSFAETEEIEEVREKASILDGSIPPIKYSIGRYVVDEISLEPSAMYDRAVMAKESIKGRYDVHIAVYDAKMRDCILQEQEIAGEMKKALDEGQFEVWYQPQFNHATGSLIGAEALVRWRHPVKGLISPGVFIPIFEKNGFVYEVDRFVWEQVCIYLKKILDASAQIIPISVNISRYDIYRSDLVEFIYGLTQKYQIPVEALRLEITESAFTESTDQLIYVIKSLKNLGFIIEIDDFGSGYSSLNTLKDVPADIVKLDMRFLEGNDQSDRGGSILESVVRMTRWIGMSAIAEGVERLEQADFLKSIGCYYIQGYLYSKPLPGTEFDRIIEDSEYAEKVSAIETVETYDSETFWSPKSIDTLIFNSFVGGACVFEYRNGRIEIIRVNDKYARIICGESIRSRDAIRVNWNRYLTPESAENSHKAMQKAIHTGAEVVDEMELPDFREQGESVYLRATMRVIASTGDRYLFYCVLEDMTQQRKAEMQERRMASKLEAVLANISAGVSVCYYQHNKATDIIYANDRFYEQRGYSKQQYMQEVSDVMDLIHPKDLTYVQEKAEHWDEDVESYELTYRVRKRSGTYIWVKCKMSQMMLDGYEGLLQLAVTDDITKEYEAIERESETDTLMQLILENVANGVTAVALDGDKVEYLFTNDKYCNMLGYTKQQYLDEVTDTYALFHPDDRDFIYEKVHQLMPGDKPLKLEYRAKCRDGSMKTIRMIIVSKEYGKEKQVLQLSVFEDITEEAREEERRKELLENIPCGAGIFDISDGKIRTVYLNEKYWQLIGRQPDASRNGMVMDVIKLEDRASLPMLIQRASVSGQEQECELHILHGKGHYVPFLVRAGLAKSKTKNKMLYVTYTPITEDTLTYRQMLPVALETMMASSTDISFIKDRALTYVCASHTFAEMVGFKDENEIIGMTDYDLFEKSVADRFRADDNRIVKDGKSAVDYTDELPFADGTLRYINTSKYLLRDQGKNIIGIYGVGRDVTDNREAFKQLKLLTDTIPGGLVTFELSSQDIRTMYISDGAYSIIGYQKGERDILHFDPLSFVEESDRKDIRQQLERLLTGRESTNCTCRLVQKNGEYKWVNMRGVVAQRKNDRITLNTVMLDVTEQVNAKEKVDQMEQENRRRYEHERSLRKGLVKDSILYYQMNLTSGLIEEYESKYGNLSNMEQGSRIDEYIREFIASRIYPEDVEKVSNVMFYDALKSAYAQGKRYVSVIYRRLLVDEDYHWVKMDAFMTEKPDGGDAIAFLHCKDIDHEWKSHLSIETILDEDIESVIYVNVRSGIASVAHMLEKANYNRVYYDFIFDEESMKWCNQIIIEDDRDKYKKLYCIESLKEALQDEQIVTAAYRINSQGTILRKLMKAYYLDETKEVIVIIRRDITRLYEEEQKQKLKLQEAVDKANQANHAKSDFLSNMSHDIRTPLNAVLAFSNPELLEGADRAKLMEYLGKVNVSGEYLLGIINDVLDMSRIEQDRIKLNPEPYSLDYFVKTIRNVIDELSKNREIQFTMDTSRAGIPEMLVDHVRFNQIFINLLSNAVKFTPVGGKVEFIIEELQEEQTGQTIKRFIVRDNGIGMSEEFLPHAFESFNQEYRKDTSERNQGTGLGLSIVEKLVHMMQGTIRLESRLNQGTTFTVDFPYELTKVTKQTGQNEPKVQDYSKLKGIHILLGEDNDINTEIATALLEKHGCIVERAENGEEAWKRFEASAEDYYQLILMDIRMPVMDGLEATRKIRALKRKDAKTIPIIAMTADAFNEDERIAYKAGMNAHTAKPIDPPQLYDICCSFLP